MLQSPCTHLFIPRVHKYFDGYVMGLPTTLSIHSNHAIKSVRTKKTRLVLIKKEKKYIYSRLLMFYPVFSGCHSPEDPSSCILLHPDPWPSADLQGHLVWNEKHELYLQHSPERKTNQRNMNQMDFFTQ